MNQLPDSLVTSIFDLARCPDLGCQVSSALNSKELKESRNAYLSKVVQNNKHTLRLLSTRMCMEHIHMCSLLRIELSMEVSYAKKMYEVRRSQTYRSYTLSEKKLYGVNLPTNPAGRLLDLIAGGTSPPWLLDINASEQREFARIRARYRRKLKRKLKCHAWLLVVMGTPCPTSLLKYL